MKRPSRNSGFTLFELVLVLILLAAAASLVAPRALKLHERRLDANLRQAHAMARHARSLAVTRGAASRIMFDDNDGRFWIEIEKDPFERPGEFEAPGDEWGTGIRLMEGVRFETLETDAVTFRPDGTSDDAVIVLAAGEEERKGLEIRGATGTSRVLEGDELLYFEWKLAEGR